MKYSKNTVQNKLALNLETFTVNYNNAHAEFKALFVKEVTTGYASLDEYKGLLSLDSDLMEEQVYEIAHELCIGHEYRLGLLVWEVLRDAFRDAVSELIQSNNDKIAFDMAVLGK